MQRGDSLNIIAKKFGVKVSEIRAKSGLDRDSEIWVGQELRMPYRGQKGAVVQEERNAKEQLKEEKPHSGSVKTISLSAARKYVGHLLWPVGANGGYLSSRFGRRWFTFHEGLDIAGNEGLPVYAAHSGQVVYSGDGLRGYGNLVVVRGDGLLTVYGHNQRNRTSRGAFVKQGERIADLGASGKATGPHLHFETRIRNKDGKYAAVDPLAFFVKER